MDLKSLLNTGKPPLTEERIASLTANSDNVYKLEQMTNATFAIPDQPESCYKYFDDFLQLLASFGYNNDSDLDTQYTTTALVASLRACINELLISNGLTWLLSLPRHISHTTWTMLQSSSTILAYVYGLLLALATRQQVETSAWVEEIVHFVKAASPYLNAHLWLSVTALEQRSRQNHDSQVMKMSSTKQSDYASSFLLSVERSLDSEGSNESIQKALISMLFILEDGESSTLSSTIDQYLGNVASRPPFTDQELIVGKIAFDQCLKLCKATNLTKLLNRYDVQRQQSNSEIDLQLNPLISDVLMEMPAGSEIERAQSLKKPLAQWCYHLQTFSFNDFDHHLKNIIDKQYPNDRKTNLDLLITEWIQKDEMVAYLEPILGYITARLRAEKYDKRSSPFWSFIHLYAETNYQRSDQKALYGEVSGAQVDSDIDYAWDDSRRQRTCDKVLQILTFTNTDDALTTWINDILQVASARVLARYLEWVSYKVNSINSQQEQSSASGLRNNLYYKQLNNVFKGDHIKTKSDTVIPTLMRALNPDVFLDLVETRAYLNAMVKSYFLKPPEMTFELLVNELLQSQTKDFMLRLFNVLGVQNRQNSQWFANHFLGPVLRHETNNIGKESFILKHLLVTDHFFTNLFLRTFNITTKGIITVNTAVKTSSIQLLRKHMVLKSQSCGLLRLLEEIVRLREPKRQACIIHIWQSSWTCDKALQVNDQWLLCCLLFYGQASAAVQQLIETFVMGHLETLLFAADKYNVAPTESLLNSQGDVPSFLSRVVDLTLLADIVDPEDVFVMIIAQLLSMPAPEDGNESLGKVNASKVLYQAVVILTETADELAFLTEQDNENSMDIDPQVTDSNSEKKLNAKQRKRRRLEQQKKGRAKKGRSHYIASELPSDLTDSDPASDRYNLTLYAQRIVSLFSSVLTGDGIRYITADIRQFITQSWANCQDLYIPFAFLMTIRSQDTMIDDITKIIHVLRAAVADSNPLIETIIKTEEKRHNISFVNS
ncbi:hypothetical protein INT43_000070 [Umbelopsis isabellina]|uniref:Uncharacterized protein n=1 Tax=Mortierella isabellina TaxID=91625 RepID=A0A8H7PF34_MORIS|nr:hypothetical protein INT43_000070 [Umbelopsis isabellina]